MTSIAPLKAVALRLARNESGKMLIAFTAAMLLLRLCGNIVLTRLLDPQAFGVVGVIISVMVVLTMLSDFGFAGFVIRHERGAERRLLDVIWTIRLGQSTLQMLAMMICAWPVALFLAKPELALPIAETAPLFLANALCPMTLLLAQRQGRVRTTCAIEFGALAAQIGANLALTLVLPDYRALIAGLYVGAAVRLILTLWMVAGGSRVAWDKALAHDFFAFSRWIMASTVLTLLITQSDKILFARLFSVADFGVYMLPVNLALAVQPFGRNYVERYFFPLIARNWHAARETLPGIFYSARARLFPLLFAAFGFGIGGAPLLFRILFDHRYEYGWIYFSVLMLRLALDLDAFTNVQTLIATGRTAPALHANLIRLALFAAVAATLFRPLGPVALPLALAAAEAGGLIYTTVLLLRDGLFAPRRHALYYAALTAGAVAGLGMSIIFAADVMHAGLAQIG